MNFNESKPEGATMKQEIFLGNGAIALGLMEAGCQVMTSYPGTPSSEILPEVIRWSNPIPEHLRGMVHQ
jgi:pyruvate/2-oxoacid:ferredoxin oxidoreductase alpha subunit